MPRAKTFVHNYQFIKGLVTDASPLTFPENTCSELYNFKLNTDGSLELRKGLYSVAYVFGDTQYTSTDSRRDTQVVRWDNALPGVDVLVVADGISLSFHVCATNGIAPTVVPTYTGVSIPILFEVPSTASWSPLSLAPMPGYLIVTSKHTEMGYVTLDATTMVATFVPFRVYERDFEGYFDSNPTTARPEALIDTHAYNLLNRGWSTSKINSFNTELGYYPALSDLVNFGYYDNPTTGLEAWKAAKVVDNSSITSPATEGAVLLDTLYGTASTLATTAVTELAAAITHTTYKSGSTDAPEHGGIPYINLTVNTDITSVVSAGDMVRVSGNPRYRYENLTPQHMAIHTLAEGDYTVLAITATNVRIAAPSHSDYYNDLAAWGATSGCGVYSKGASLATIDIGVTSTKIYRDWLGNPATDSIVYIYTEQSAEPFLKPNMTVTLTSVPWEYTQSAVTYTGTLTGSYSVLFVGPYAIGVRVPGVVGPLFSVNNTKTSTTDTDLVTVDLIEYSYYRPRDPAKTRFASACVWAGRVWYSGLEETGLSNRLYFSQVTEGPSKFGKCYQEADPTSRHISELVATDGGVIVFNDIGRILHIAPFQNYLLVFTTSGVWSVFGRDGIFDATSYGTKKISNDVIISPRAAVDTGAGFVFWASSSISVILDDPTTGSLVAKSLTDGVLSQYIKQYTTTHWPYIKAAYMTGDRRVAFILPSTTLAVNDKILWYDLTLGAFYEYRLDVAGGSANLPSVNDLVYLRERTTDEDRAVAFVAYTISGSRTIVPCSFSSTTYKDMSMFAGGVFNVLGKIVTGHTNGGDAAKAKQGTYIHVHMATITDSSLLMRAIWDFSNSSSSNKHTSQQQCYDSGDTYRHVASRKLRVRGWGKSLQVEFTTEALKPCKIYGWDLGLEMNQID